MAVCTINLQRAVNSENKKMSGCSFLVIAYKESPTTAYDYPKRAASPNLYLLVKTSTTNMQPKPNTDAKTDATAKSAGRRIRATFSSS
jgi:hypothetical protein